MDIHISDIGIRIGKSAGNSQENDTNKIIERYRKTQYNQDKSRLFLYGKEYKWKSYRQHLMNVRKICFQGNEERNTGYSGGT